MYYKREWLVIKHTCPVNISTWWQRYEPAKFNRRVQQRNEAVEEYINSLYVLIQYCDYGNLRHEMLRDRIVVGLRDVNLSEKLQMNPELTLKQAQDIVRESEAIKKQQNELRASSTADDELDAIRSNPKRYLKKLPPGNNKQKQKHRGKCTRCGRSPPHKRENCPAGNTTCNKCSKLGHWAVVCRSKNTEQINEQLTNKGKLYECRRR